MLRYSVHLKGELPVSCGLPDFHIQQLLNPFHDFLTAPHIAGRAKTDTDGVLPSGLCGEERIKCHYPGHLRQRDLKRVRYHLLYFKRQISIYSLRHVKDLYQASLPAPILCRQFTNPF